MTTVADTIEAKFVASWSAGTRPTGYASSDYKKRPDVKAEYILYVEYFETARFRPSTQGYDRKIVTLPIECYTTASKDRLDAIVAEIRSLCIDLMPATYDHVTVTSFDMNKSSFEKKMFGATVVVEVTTLAEAR